jgi:L-seryl-tRNA(Ser) seleniumtransferase
MNDPQTAESAAWYRLLPSTDELLVSPVGQRLSDEIGRRTVTVFAREAIDSIRREFAEQATGQKTTHSKESLFEEALRRLHGLADDFRTSGLRKVINATGVVIHTNLGRAPLSPAAVDAITQAAGYCNLEYDISTGKRGRRGSNVESILAELTGADAAIVVNNCAAAAFLVLSVFAKGGETIVSRGELVEIGGDFRVPDVLAQSGSILREVGTTNRTRLSDYSKAIGESTKLLMRVHPSNYKIIGFTDKPSLAELTQLAHDHDLLLYEDAGSGALVDVAGFGLPDEPMISRAIADGADIVTFSGDKLLGGSQAGIVVGRGELIEQLRKHPLYRALRVDKLAYAALEATARIYLRDQASNEVPVLRMMSLTRDEIEPRAKGFEVKLRGLAADDVAVELLPGVSVVGGGAAPGTKLDTLLIAIKRDSVSPEVIELKLRMSETPVIARIEKDQVVIDLRTVAESDEDLLLKTVAAVVG